MGSVSGTGRSPEGGNGNPVQYSCLGNPMDRGAWWAAVHGFTKNWARLSGRAWLVCQAPRQSPEQTK